MPLELPPDDFEILANRACRAAVDYLAGLDARPSAPQTSGTATAEISDRPLPEEGMQDSPAAWAAAGRQRT